MAGGPASSGPPLGRRRLAHIGQLVAVVVILVLAWPARSQIGRITLDVSWQLGLHQAAEQGLRFGRDIVFTYGPLGFLARPTPFIGPTSALAFVATAAIYMALIGLLLHRSLKLFPAWFAVLLTLVFARAFGWLEPFEALQILAFGLGVEVLRRDGLTNSWRVPVVAGLLASVAILGKLNVGVFAGAMAFIVVLAISRPRLHGILRLGAVAAAATVGAWLLAGQQLSDLIPYVRASEEIIAGYSEAMGVTPANAGWIYLSYIVLAVIVVAVAYRTSIGWPRDRRLALTALVILQLFACWKFAFVRSHVGATFVTLGFATLFLLPGTMRLRVSVPILLAVSMVFLLIMRPASYPDVMKSSIDFVRQARDTALPWRWEAAADRTREKLRSAFKVPTSILAELDGRSVSIDPYAAAIAPAYGAFTWRPVPIFQSYSAYTPALDRLDADVLRSDARPERILRAYGPRHVSADLTVPYAIDGRNYWFESPEATAERLCRYREVAVSGNYQVLADSGRGCGAEIPLGTVTAALGETVSVPAAPSPNDLVLVRVHGVDESPLARLRSTLWRSPDWSITVDGLRYRLVPGTAKDGLVLAVPAAAAGSAPFAFGAPARTIAVDGSNLGSDKLTYEFFTRRLPE